MASQITSLTIVYSTVYPGANQRKHQSSKSLAFVRGIHRWPVNSPHKRPVTRKMFPLDGVIMDKTRLLFFVLNVSWNHVEKRWIITDLYNYLTPQSQFLNKYWFTCDTNQWNIIKYKVRKLKSFPNDDTLECIVCFTTTILFHIEPRQNGWHF